MLERVQSSPPMLKIIAGEFRSRMLLSPEDAGVSRPYASRAKESVFNLLRGWFEEGARVLDLFAGVGTMGLEAVSRGAAQVVMVERNREIFRLLERNIATLGCADRATAVLGDALSPLALDRAPQPVDIVFIDPPYEMLEEPSTRARVLEQIARLREVMADRGFVVLRSPIGSRDADFTVPGFAGPEEHTYGKGMHVMLYAPSNES
jgi:16S rRNA (guanine(966)-N(2))-methyltransferase RsmD